MILTESIYQQIEQRVLEANPHAFLVEAQLIRGKRNVLSVKVDTDRGISLAECATISRHIGKWLEESDSFSFSYELEVSSPGIGSPLVLHRQYLKNTGRKLQVLLEDGRLIEGKLTTVADESIVLTPVSPKTKPGKQKRKTDADAPQTHTIFFKDIKRSKVII
ncbi:MAG: hypothetical protein D6730_06810 [Bacteroidetes bacterium]|nr:MAG: hypothetical protein D6730_06810 [Bacteroidota bacterium]